MPRFKLHILFAVLVFFVLATGPSNANTKGLRTIVMFFSWNASLPAYNNILDGFYSTFSRESEINCNILTEYLDMSRLENEEYARKIVNLYNVKFSDTSIDLIVVIGPGCYHLLKAYGLKALEKTPVISIENDDLSNDTINYPDAKNLVKIEMYFDFVKTLETAFRLFPANNKVFVIGGVSTTDEFYTQKIKSAENQLKGSQLFKYLTDITMDSAISFVKTIPPNSLVFVPAFSLDRNKISYSTPEVISILSKYCKAPIFPAGDTYLKKRGALGGYVFSFYNVGKEAGRVANQVLGGKLPQEIKIDNSNFYQSAYDWKELRKWGLQDSRLIPSNSLISYNQPSFFYLYRWYIVAVFIFLISQTFMILHLVRLNRRLKEIARQKEETENIYREMVREDRLLKMFELTASLSHELNQPLTAILYNAQAGKRFLNAGKVELKQLEEIFDFIIEDDKRAGGIISSVRSLMKLENRENENVNLRMLLQETLNIFHSEAIRKNIKVETSFCPDAVWVYADKIQLQQVIVNFIRNAINAMEITPPGDKVMVVILSVGKGSVTVSIHDSGPGIAPEIKERLFKPFVTNNKKGFGIGLALSRSIIEKHNGEIWALNLPNGGAQFSFRLKIAKDVK